MRRHTAHANLTPISVWLIVSGTARTRCSLSSSGLSGVGIFVRCEKAMKSFCILVDL